MADRHPDLGNLVEAEGPGKSTSYAVFTKLLHCVQMARDKFVM